MNFLDLCKDVARETGTVAGGSSNLVTVEGSLPARIDKIASWTAKAWRNIQQARATWLWMDQEFTAPLTIGVPRYSGATLGQARVAEWKGDTPDYQPFSLWDPTTGVADEGSLTEIDYNTWRARWQRGTHDRDRPVEYARAPSGEIVFGPTPDKAYMIRGEYHKTPQDLTLNADVPEMPAQHHDLIVWEAVLLLSDSDEAPISSGTANAKASVLRSRLERDQLPTVEVSIEPLA